MGYLGGFLVSLRQIGRKQRVTTQYPEEKAPKALPPDPGAAVTTDTSTGGMQGPAPGSQAALWPMAYNIKGGSSVFRRAAG